MLYIEFANTTLNALKSNQLSLKATIDFFHSTQRFEETLLLYLNSIIF